MSRRLGSAAAIVLGTLFLLAGTLTLYAKRNVLDAPRFSERVLSTLDDADVRDELARIGVAELERQVSPDLVALRGAIEPALVELAGTTGFAEALGAALEAANEVAFDRGADRFAVVLIDSGALLRERLDGVAPGLAARIPDGLDVRIADLSEAPALIELAQAADRVRTLGTVLPILGLALLGAGIAFARDRRTAAFGAGLGVALAGGALFLGYSIGRELTAELPASDDGQAAVELLWSAILGDLRDWALGLAAIGALVAGLAVVALERGRIALAVVAGTATAGAAAAAFAFGGDDPPTLTPSFGSECNGSAELCDRAFDRVAFATAHNAMSAAGYPGYLFPMQDAPIADQLDSGIRGLMLDVYYGLPGRRVFTDFSRSPSSLIASAREKLGPELIAAADKLRKKIGRPSSEEASLFLCHGFCELGAVPVTEGLDEIAQFLDANPGEVVTLIFEDYVEPSDMAAAIEASGVGDHVYEGSTDEWPTLGEMAGDDQRVLVMAENRTDGGPPWYHQAYDLMQETGFDYSSPAKMGRDCEPNRGEPDNPLFLINNWINTDPAARPSNARVVNDRKFLLDRARLCERERDALVNYLAIDFFREGEVVGTVDALNAYR